MLLTKTWQGRSQQTAHNSAVPLSKRSCRSIGSVERPLLGAGAVKDLLRPIFRPWTSRASDKNLTAQTDGLS